MAVQSLHIHLVPSHILIIFLKDSKDSAHFKCEGKLFQICEPSIERLFEPYVVVFLRFISKLFLVLFRTGRLLSLGVKMFLIKDGFRLLIVLKISIQRDLKRFTVIWFLYSRRNHRQLPAQSYPQYRIHQYQTETSLFY